MNFRFSHKTSLLFGLLFVLAGAAAQADECGGSLFTTPPANVAAAKARFETLARTLPRDSVVDSIFEVALAGKSVAEIDRAISNGQADYFKPSGRLQAQNDGFSQDYDGKDGAWKKTVKVSTHNPKGLAIVPYLQIFYEDRHGGVIRLKPYGNSDAPAALVHLKRAHGTGYFKLDPAGDLSYENEAFKVHDAQALPKSPTQVKLPEGVSYGSAQAEDFLSRCWTYKTHVPLAQ